MSVNLYKKMLEAWSSADDKETKFQQLLESWVKTIDTKNSYRELLQEWIESDENLAKKLDNLIVEWATWEEVHPYQAMLDDWIITKEKGEKYSDLLEKWVGSCKKENPTKTWIEDLVTKATNPETNN